MLARTRALAATGLLGLAGALLDGSLGGCAALLPRLEPPRLQVVGVNLGHGNLAKQKINVTLNVDNPNNRVLDIGSIDVNIALSGTDFATGVTAEPFAVPALGSTQFTIDLTANLETALKLIAASYGADTIPYRITGEVHLAGGVIRNLPFKSDGNVPLKKLEERLEQH
ncbi:MAG TPA: LEA type 2 family protein [Steroidobacteraceae bacterium]|nr:LEA type 2 family protein [Steroidobacteraceae bacterium]